MSRFYVHVSRRYIRTGLDTMDTLSRTDIDQFKANQRKLQDWCGKATDEIEALAREVRFISYVWVHETKLDIQTGYREGTPRH